MRFVLLAIWASAAFSEGLYRVDAFAGSNFAGDGGPAVEAPLVQPQGLAVDRDGSILVADPADHRVRRIRPNGLIDTVAGDGVPGLHGLQSPYGIAVGPNREVYIADLGNRRVQVVTLDGSIRTFAGGGEKDPGESPAPAVQVKLNQPRNVVVDINGVVYVSDFGARRIYRITRDGMLTALPDPGLNAPAGLAIDGQGVLYIADAGLHSVSRLSNGKLEALLSSFGTVTSIALDPAGFLYAAGGDRVAVISPTGEVSTIYTPADEVAIDSSGRILTVAFRQVRALFARTTTTILAGSAKGAFAGDGGPKEQARFHRPTGLIREEAGSVLVADSGNGRVRRISADGVVSTVAILGEPAYFVFDASSRLFVSDAKTGTVYATNSEGRLLPFSKGTGAKPFRSPSGLAFDARGDLYVADTGNGLIRKVTPDGFVTTVAGGGSSGADGFGLGLELKRPVGLAMASDGTLWFTETGKLRRLTREGRVSTVPELPLLDPRGLRIEPKSQAILVADAGLHQVLRVNPNGSWEAIAGTGQPGYSGDGGMARQAAWEGPSDVLLEADGSLLVTDTANSRVRRLTPAATAPQEIQVPKLQVLHAATDKLTPVAPGQTAVIVSESVLTAGQIKVLFGAASATILDSQANRITVVVPAATPIGTTEVILADANGPRGLASIEVVAQAPGLLRGIENEDRSQNSLDHPALRGSEATIRITGEGIGAEPWIQVAIGGMEAEVLSLERKPGHALVRLRIPSGYLPSGVLPLHLTVDSVAAAEEVTIVCR